MPVILYTESGKTIVENVEERTKLLSQQGKGGVEKNDPLEAKIATEVPGDAY